MLTLLFDVNLPEIVHGNNTNKENNTFRVYHHLEDLLNAILYILEECDYFINRHDCHGLICPWFFLSASLAKDVFFVLLYKIE